jgi:SAM-dependent MidA family methyltransferase
MCLTEIIKDRIQEEGPMPFRDFMEMALYHHELGYYTSSHKRIGTNGDYYTSPYLTSLFGEIIAKQLEEMWQLLGKKEFTIVEYGAGQGLLCNDILHELEKNQAFYQKIRYCIIEKSTAMREHQKRSLPEKVTWHESIGDIGSFSGCILSNELLDNFSVHKVVMKDELKEIFVDYDDGFKEVALTAESPLKAYFDQLDVSLPQNFCTEINLQATEWMHDNAQALEEGFIITIDYGFLSSELYTQNRRNGTLVCYHKHTINTNPYENIGEQDITAHINFSALQHWGIKYGLTSCGFTNQTNFLQALGLVNHLRNLEQRGKHLLSGNMEKLFLVHTLLMDMGRKFKVLIQQKSDRRSQLTGMRFAQQLS